LAQGRWVRIERQRGGGGFYELIALTKASLSEVSVKG